MGSGGENRSGNQTPFGKLLKDDDGKEVEEARSNGCDEVDPQALFQASDWCVWPRPTFSLTHALPDNIWLFKTKESREGIKELREKSDIKIHRQSLC
jgi:hypothetical protein